MSDNPQTASGTPGTTQPPAPLQGLPAGPPAGAYTDAQYLASEAQLRQQISSQYQDLLSQLGYYDPDSGGFIPGSVQQNAQIAEDQANQQRQQAIQQNDQNAQQNGITFSGERGVMQGQATLPYDQQIAGIEFQTPQTLSDLYRQANDLVNSYNTQNQMLLADAASRATGRIDSNPPGGAPAQQPPYQYQYPTAPPPPAPEGGGTASASTLPQQLPPPNNPPPPPHHRKHPPPSAPPGPQGPAASVRRQLPALDDVTHHAMGLIGAIHNRLNPTTEWMG